MSVSRALAIGAVVLLAAAAPSSCASTIGSSGIGITMELEFAPAISPAEAAAIDAQFSAKSGDEAPSTVKCNRDYSWSNAVGTYHVQRACGSSTAPWSLQLNPGVQAIVSGNIVETGMQWTVDGKTQGKQSPHEEWPGYVLHGSYSGLSDGSVVRYEDSVTFQHVLGSGGSATVTLSGTHKFSDEAW